MPTARNDGGSQRQSYPYTHTTLPMTIAHTRALTQRHLTRTRKRARTPQTMRNVWQQWHGRHQKASN
eukprot:5347681-Pyramimonas_sp.AAC.1